MINVYKSSYTVLCYSFHLTLGTNNAKTDKERTDMSFPCRFLTLNSIADGSARTCYGFNYLRIFYRVNLQFCVASSNGLLVFYLSTSQ